MPDMARTELQFARLLGATRRPVELVLALPASYRSGQEGTGLYARWDEASLPRRLDGLIVTGAPLEHLPFEQVTYWRELARICDWAAANVERYALHLLGGLRGALPVPRRANARPAAQAFGRLPAAGHGRKRSVDRRLGATFPCPVSRYAEVATQDVPWRRGLTCLAQSSESRLCLIADRPRRAHYMFNHLEYDADTLKLEYLRDRARRADTAVPRNYLPDDDVSKSPPLLWRRPAETLIANWLAILAAHQRDRAAADLGRSAA